MCNNLWLQKIYTCILITRLFMCRCWEDIRPVLPCNKNVAGPEGSSLLACNAVLFPTFCRVVIPSSACSSSQYINPVILWIAINYLYSDVASHYRILLGLLTLTMEALWLFAILGTAHPLTLSQPRILDFSAALLWEVLGTTHPVTLSQPSILDFSAAPLWEEHQTSHIQDSKSIALK